MSVKEISERFHNSFQLYIFAITQHLKSIEKQWWWWDICNIHRMNIRERGDTLHIQNPNNFNTQSNWILILLQVSLSLSIASSVRSSSARSKFSMFLNSLEHIVCGMLMAMTKKINTRFCFVTSSSSPLVVSISVWSSINCDISAKLLPNDVKIHKYFTHKFFLAMLLRQLIWIRQILSSRSLLVWWLWPSRFSHVHSSIDIIITTTE